MNRAEILGRLHLFLAERREIRVLPVPREETDEARLLRESEQARLDADYLAWQMSPEVSPVDVPDVDQFLSSFGWLIETIRGMDEDTLTDDELMVPFYDAAKRAYGEDRSAIRRYFRYMYILLFNSESGPRWSQLIRATGTEYFLKLVEERTSSIN